MPARRSPTWCTIDPACAGHGLGRAECRDLFCVSHVVDNFTVANEFDLSKCQPKKKCRQRQRLDSKIYQKNAWWRQRRVSAHGSSALVFIVTSLYQDRRLKTSIFSLMIYISDNLFHRKNVMKPGFYFLFFSVGLLNLSKKKSFPEDELFF